MAIPSKVIEYDDPIMRAKLRQVVFNNRPAISSCATARADRFGVITGSRSLQP